MPHISRNLSIIIGNQEFNIDKTEGIEWIQISRKYITYKPASQELPIHIGQRYSKKVISNHFHHSKTNSRDKNLNKTNLRDKNLNPRPNTYTPKGFYNARRIPIHSQENLIYNSINSTLANGDSMSNSTINTPENNKFTLNNLNLAPTKNSAKDPIISKTSNLINDRSSLKPCLLSKPNEASEHNYNLNFNQNPTYPDPIDLENFTNDLPIKLQIGPNYTKAIQNLNTHDWVSRCYFPPQETPTTRKDKEGKWYVTGYYHAKYLYTMI